jgi:uncharacterized protein YegJ (DUF2314 family)
MELLPISLVFLAALAALISDTWQPEKGLTRKINGKGQLLLALAILSFSYSIYDHVQNKKEKRQLLDLVIENIAVKFHEIELLYIEAKYIESSEELSVKLTLHSNEIERIASNNSAILDNELRTDIENFQKLLDSEAAEVRLEKNFLNSLSPAELTKESRRLRFKFCEIILSTSQFCSSIQSNPTAHQFFKQDDIEFVTAMNKARVSLEGLMNNYDWIKKSNAKLDIKTPVPMFDGTYEHIWIRVNDFDGKKFFGTVANIVESPFVNYGDNYITPYIGVEDWAIEYNGFLYGHYTLRESFKRMPESEINELLQSLKFELVDNESLMPWPNLTN